jgi:ribosomal protein S18 acetylase RimI-like enzyme
MNADWLPAIRRLSPKRPDPARTPFESWLRNLIQEPAKVPDFVDEYPAHLHIDLLPRAQGMGWGSRLMEQCLDQARSEGVPGLHLGVGLDNTKAQVFYAKQGFHEIRRDPGALYLGLKV